MSILKKKKDESGMRTSIGGQALIEGIMMRGPKKQAVVLRSKDGLVTKVEELKLLKDRYPIVGLLFVRGVVNFINSMTVGFRALMLSADNIPLEEQETPSKFDQWIEKHLGNEKAEKVIITFSLVLGVAMSVGLFMLLPTFLAGLVTSHLELVVLKNLLEGVLDRKSVV